jgi:hypothetical protein
MGACVHLHGMGCTLPPADDWGPRRCLVQATSNFTVSGEGGKAFLIFGPGGGAWAPTRTGLSGRLSPLRASMGARSIGCRCSASRVNECKSLGAGTAGPGS